MSYQDTLKATRNDMAKALKHLDDVLRQIRTGRASPALVENVRVDYYGTPTPVSQLASISIPEARSIAIKPFDVSCIKELEKAILKSDLGVSPQNDGKVVRVNLPPLSGEQRKKLGALVKEKCEESRIALRNARRDHNKESDALKKKGTLTEDEHRKLQDEIQSVLKENEKKVDEVFRLKTAEVMEV